ncbi:MAG: hypothetical protein IPO41_05600 [Acidobacteria bacterium]|nr:hypothetical protein [Acidobacteriota bacterium]
MLYELPKNPGIKSEIIEALRRRGIEFVLNDGVRSGYPLESANDDELKRALEEADRRRQNPVGTQLPSAAEITTLVEKTTKNTLDQVGDMPDFVVKQQIQRSDAFAGTGIFVTATSLSSRSAIDRRVRRAIGYCPSTVFFLIRRMPAGATNKRVAQARPVNLSPC